MKVDVADKVWFRLYNSVDERYYTPPTQGLIVAVTNIGYVVRYQKDEAEVTVEVTPKEIQSKVTRK